MHCNDPRESAGLKMLEASIAPSAAPAPTIVWSSSMKRMTSPAFSISSMTALIRSSNCPRYFVPATIRAMSSVITRFEAISSGTSPFAISCAKPSDYRGFADARLSHENRIVLCAAAQNLNYAHDFVCASHDGVELAVAGKFGEVAPERFKSALFAVFGAFAALGLGNVGVGVVGGIAHKLWV